MNFVKRKNKLENCYDSDESDSAEFLDEDEMKSYLGSDMLSSPFDSYRSDLDESSPNSTLDGKQTKFLSQSAVPAYLQNTAPTPTGSPNSSPKPNLHASSPNLPVPKVTADQPAYLTGLTNASSVTSLSLDKEKEENGLKDSTDSTNTENNNKKKTLLPSQLKQQGASLPSQKGRATMKRPAPTHKSTKRSNNNNVGKGPGGQNLRERANKRVVKQQMKILRDIGAKAQKRLLKQSRIQQKEREDVTNQYKRNMDQIIKNAELNKKQMEKQHKMDRDGLVKLQAKEVKNYTREAENKEKAVQKETRDSAKLSAKAHLANQKQLLKEQKLKLKQSKKGTSASGFKNMKKEQKVEIQLNDLLYTLSTVREQKFAEIQLEWSNNTSYDSLMWNQLIQTQKHEKDCQQQLLNLEFDTNGLKFNCRREELQKLQPLNQKHLRENHELQENNLKAQLQVEREQQMTLLAAEHKRMTKEVNIKKKMTARAEETKVKQLSKGKSKNEIKQLQQDARNRIAAANKTLDDDFETTAETQKREQEEDLDIYQKHVFQQLVDNNKLQAESLEQQQAKAELELRQEEIQTRKLITLDHHSKDQALLEKHHTEQLALQEKQHTDKLNLLRNQHKNCISLIEAQHSELLAFLQTKLEGEPNKTFTDKIETEIKEVKEYRQACNNKMQADVSEKLEQEERDLKKTQFKEKQWMEAGHEKENEKISALESNNEMLLTNTE